ncbi:M14 family metallopeptidase [Halochromatium glycolicum]|nr:M14 family metallopeptidase [Halochromatium glycolicum]
MTADSMRLHELDRLPDGLLELNSAELATHLQGPTLIHLPGEREQPLFVSVLIHGNEPVGWDAVRLLLRQSIERHGHLRLPRAMSLFIGNVHAAAANARHLPDQPDFNRVWPGADTPASPAHTLMAQVVERMAQRQVFASIDLHNNTGTNPHYACVNLVDNRYLHLARLFSRTVVFFVRPKGVQSQAMSRLCPATTLECGRVGDRHGVEHAREFIDACLHLAEVPDQALPPQDVDLFHTVAQVTIPEHVSFGFPPHDAQLILSPELERFNFRELPAGASFARIRDGGHVVVRDEHGRDVSDRFFAVDDGELKLREPAMPSMLTADATVIRQDCLCYLMERFSHHLPHRH